MIKRLLKKIKKNIAEKPFKEETKRLLNLPRYQPGESTLLKPTIHYVDSITLYYGYKELFTAEPYKFHSQSPEPYIIDCGANIGLSVIYFKQLYPNSKIIAFEPDKAIFKVLSDNLDIQKITGVELVNKAVWVNSEGIEFEIEGGMSGRINKYKAEKNIVKVETVRLKDLLIKPVDFLKIDIEGAEFEVIKDCGADLKQVKNLFIEYHSHISEKQSLGELLSILALNGFRYHIKEAYTVNHPFIEQGDMLGMDLQLNIFAINQHIK